MPVTDKLELPIERLQIDGQAVRALRDRKEDNNHERMTAERLNASYGAVKNGNLDALKALGEQTYGG